MDSQNNPQQPSSVPPSIPPEVPLAETSPAPDAASHVAVAPEATTSSYSQYAANPGAYDQPQDQSFQAYPMPPEDPGAGSSVVVMGGDDGSVPRWFYILFTLTLIAFFSVGGLLISSYIKNSPFVSQTNTPAATKPTGAIGQNAPVTPTHIPRVTPTIVAGDAAIHALSQVRQSSEVDDLEKDVAETDFSFIRSDLDALNASMSAQSR